MRTVKYYAVLLHGDRVGTLCQTGDHTRFMFNERYLHEPARPVLGLRFEERLRDPYAAALRLPPWFSNLLPEGPLREWIAKDRHVSVDREMELLAQVGHDLPGAVQVMVADGPDDSWDWSEYEGGTHSAEQAEAEAASPWRFSLAGVALKFSMLAQGDRLAVPAVGEHGDWLVKFPDYRHSNVPHNEFAMMSLARSAGLDVPEVRLVHRDELDGVPARMWPNSEEWAYAVRRFDRASDGGRGLVHMEDLAQVRDWYSRAKYEGSFETVLALIHRGRDLDSLAEAVRRIAFCVVTGNGDAHLKNWSLLYRDQRVPTLSPVYDLVSTAVYMPDSEPEDMGLKLDGGKRFAEVRGSTFARVQARLERKLGALPVDFTSIAVETAAAVRNHWDEHADKLGINPKLCADITDWIGVHTRVLMSAGSN